MKRIALQVAAAFGAVAMLTGSARADVTLTQDETWTDGRTLSGTIDLAGHKLTVSSLTGNATITDSTATGYQILDYLDSDGKAYVNTGLSVASDTVVDIKFRLLQNSGNTFVSYVGSRVTNKSDSQFADYIQNLKHYWAVSKNEGFNGTIALNTDYTVHLDKNGPCTINGGGTLATGSGVGNDLSIMIFGVNMAGKVDARGFFRVYFCRIAYGDDLQRDLKPARRLSDGALGLLDVKDKANLVFYENQDTSGAFTAGPVVSEEFATHSSELHIAVASGETANSTVAIAGAVRVVKEGAGTFIATKQGQTYCGGTDIVAGTFRCGADGQNGVYGADGCQVTVRTGATFDCDGWANHVKFPFVLDGGTVKNTTSLGKANNSWFANVTLTKDSFMSGHEFGFVGGNWAEGILRLNGHTLTVDVTSAKAFYVGNLKGEGGGEIYAKTGGYFVLGGNSTLKSGKYVRAETTTLRMGGACVYDGGGEHVFGSYVSEHTLGYDEPGTVIKVLDRFVPGTMWHATELQNGATLDLSGCAGIWNTSCYFEESKVSATATFVAGATINIDLGTRVLEDEMKLIGWTDADAPLPTVQFKLPDEVSEDFMLRRGSDGLYVDAAVKTATWTGAVDADCSKPANWDCRDANGNKIDDALPGSITAVTLTGAVQLDIPANSFSCASFTCSNASLKGDCDWRGLGQTLGGSIDLAGHKLTVSSLAGDATITNSVASGYEILDYIDSDGKAYVDTGVKTANNTVIDIKMRMWKKSSEVFVSYAGSRVTNKSADQFAGYVNSSDSGHYWAVSADEGWGGSIALNTDYQIHLDKNGPCTINGGSQLAKGSGVGNDLTIMVFGANTAGEVGSRGFFRVYSCRIAYGDAVQRDLKPARRLSDGALGLLDVKDSENLTFYENQDASGAFIAGPVVSGEFVKEPGELHVAVASGSTENSQVAISGPVRVVKEGAGTFVATKKNQTYSGGTDITAGTFRCGADGGDHIYGVDGSTVTVREGATFDCDGWANHPLFHFVLDGGTVKSETNRDRAGWSWFADVALTKDSFMTGRNFGFVGTGWAAGVLQMNGHTLTVDVIPSMAFYAGNLTVEGGGEIYMRTGGYFALGGNPSGAKYVRAETTTLRMGGACVNDAGGEHVFGSYISEHTLGYDGPKTVIKVLDRFVPGQMWHATELQNGATLDLSACAGTWNTSCYFEQTKVSATATFAAGSTIFVDLGARKVKSSEPVVTWGAKPANVKFQPVPGAAGSFTAKDNGLYWRIGFSVIVR